MKSLAVPLGPIRDMNHPFVQQIHAVYVPTCPSLSHRQGYQVSSHSARVQVIAPQSTRDTGCPDMLEQPCRETVCVCR